MVCKNRIEIKSIKKNFSARCHNIIEASSVVWEDKKFHESCFTCWGIDKNDVPCRKVRYVFNIYIRLTFSIYLANER